jgi:putative lipoic acid-binding regulatory protein
MSDKNEFYSKLKVQLEDTTDFPAEYMYKFIVPSGENRTEQVEQLFDNTGAVIKTKQSKTGKYVSLSIVLQIESAEKIISYYKKAEKIKGIISL